MEFPHGCDLLLPEVLNHFGEHCMTPSITGNRQNFEIIQVADVEADESKYANLLFSSKTPSGMNPKIYIKKLKFFVLRVKTLNRQDTVGIYKTNV